MMTKDEFKQLLKDHLSIEIETDTERSMNEEVRKVRIKLKVDQDIIAEDYFWL